MTLRSELIAFLNEYLAIGSYDDISTNGLVVGAPEDREVKRVAFAVDANLATFQMACQWKADMLFTHHGLFWGRPLAITGAHYNRIKTLIDGNVDLFVCHIPLDAHRVVGNNAQMAEILGITDLHDFAPFRGKNVGWWGESSKPLSVEEINRKLGFSHPFVLPYGPKEIHSIGFVSGGGSEDVAEAIDLGLDCFVTGAALHEQASDCEEHGITMIGAGHYASEVFGVQAVARLLHEKFGLETTFLAHDLGL